MQYIKSTYESKYGTAVVEIETNDYSQTIHNKWDLDDVVIDVVLYEPNENPLNKILSPMRVTIEYIVKYKLNEVSVDDI